MAPNDDTYLRSSIITHPSPRPCCTTPLRLRIVDASPETPLHRGNRPLVPRAMHTYKNDTPKGGTTQERHRQPID
jgi:hypothetical protein